MVVGAACLSINTKCSKFSLVIDWLNVMGGGTVEKTSSIVTLDLEWLALILQAKGLGLSPEDVRYFLQEEVKRS